MTVFCPEVDLLIPKIIDTGQLATLTLLPIPTSVTVTGRACIELVGWQFLTLLADFFFFTIVSATGEEVAKCTGGGGSSLSALFEAVEEAKVNAWDVGWARSSS